MKQAMKIMLPVIVKGSGKMVAEVRELDKASFWL